MVGRIRTWLPALVAVALVSAACSGLSDTFRTIGAPVEESGMAGGAAVDRTTDADESPGGTGDAVAPDDGAEPADPGRAEPLATRVIDLGRDIVFTADVTIAVGDVGPAGDEARTVVAALGGFLFGQSTTSGPEPRSVLTFKVPPAAFEDALARLGGIGEVRSQTVAADDVTDRVVDLESRIDTAAASVARLRSLLDEATDIETIVALEGELLERETELESLRGSLRTLEDQVSLATIVVTLTEARANPALQLAVTAYPAHDDGLSCPGSGSLVVEQGTEATVCFEVTNVGDTWLTDFELRDPVLDLDMSEVVVVFGIPDEPIEPGESFLLAADVVPARDLRTRTTVTAVPVDEDGGALDERPASATVGVVIDAVDPGGIPTFAEGLEASLDFLVDLWAVLVLLAGALLPFAWVPVLAWVLWRRWRRRPVGAADARAEDDRESEEVAAG